jgi:hypothetical protein
MSLVTITKKLGKHHKDKGLAEVALKKERQRFFDEVSKEVAKGTLAQKVVPAPEVGDLTEWVRVYHPGWVLVEENPEEGTVLLGEDPSKTKFIFVNHKDGMVYQRNAIPEAPSLDDETLAEDHPELWERITYPVEPEGINYINDFLHWVDDNGLTSIPEGLLNKYVEDTEAFWPRELKPLEEIEHEDLEVLSEYMVPGQISLRLEKPRPAKPEELGS